MDSRPRTLRLRLKYVSASRTRSMLPAFTLIICRVYGSGAEVLDKCRPSESIRDGNE